MRAISQIAPSFCTYLRVLLLVLCAFSARAQHPYFYNLNSENGLPSNEVYQVTQDSFGFIWIGCDAGLFRYNGLNYVPYTNPRQNSKSVSNIIIDKQQNTWCQNFTGQIFRVTPNSDSLSIVYYDNSSTRAFPAFTVDTSGRLWVATDSLLLVISAKGEVLRTIPVGSALPGGRGWVDIACSANNTIYASTHDCSYAIFDANSFQATYYPALKAGITNAIITVNDRILEYVESPPGRKYTVVDITGGPGKILAEFSPLHPSGQNYIINGKGNDLILCTSAGAVVLNKELSVRPAFPVLFPRQKISNCFIDREGNFWFTSLQEGIFIIPSLRVQVFNRSNSPLKDENISSIEKKGSKELVIGTYSGELYLLNTETQALQLISGNDESKYRGVKRTIFNGNRLYAARGAFTILENGKTIILPPLNNSRDFVVVDDTIFYASSHSVGYIVFADKKWDWVVLRGKGGKKVRYDERDKQVYFACIDGLYLYNDGILSEIKNGSEAVFASYLLLDNDSLWAGTTNSGILVIKDGEVVKNISGAKLLADNNIKALVKTGNTLYAATAEGINIIDITGNTSSLLNKYDGLAYKEINELCLVENDLYVATIKGLVRIPEGKKHFNDISPSVKIVGVRKDGKAIPFSPAIELNYNDNNLTIDFVSAAFRSRGTFRYKYRLRGFDNEWRYSNSNSNSVNYSTLPPGTYIFEVYAVNEDGVASVNPARLSIEVYAPAWRKWWFYLAVFCIALLVVVWIFRARLNYVKQKAEERSKLIASQLTALKAQMNPHFMYNALNSIQAFIINNDVKNSNLYLNKFSKLMRKVLDASDMELISLQDEIDILELYLGLEKFRFGSDFNYSIRVEPNIDTHHTQLPSLILQPFIENSIKHGLLHKKGAKQLDIHFTLDKLLHCTITDNGIGRKRSEEIKERSRDYHRSFATGATEKRIELLNSITNDQYSFEITDLYENDAPSGTKVAIHIPI